MVGADSPSPIPQGPLSSSESVLYSPGLALIEKRRQEEELIERKFQDALNLSLEIEREALDPLVVEVPEEEEQEQEQEHKRPRLEREEEVGKDESRETEKDDESLLDVPSLQEPESESKVESRKQGSYVPSRRGKRVEVGQDDVLVIVEQEEGEGPIREEISEWDTSTDWGGGYDDEEEGSFDDKRGGLKYNSNSPRPYLNYNNHHRNGFASQYSSGAPRRFNRRGTRGGYHHNHNGNGHRGHFQREGFHNTNSYRGGGGNHYQGQGGGRGRYQQQRGSNYHRGGYQQRGGSYWGGNHYDQSKRNGEDHGNSNRWSSNQGEEGGWDYRRQNSKNNYWGNKHHQSFNKREQNHHHYSEQEGQLQSKRKHGDIL